MATKIRNLGALARSRVAALARTRPGRTARAAAPPGPTVPRPTVPRPTVPRPNVWRPNVWRRPVVVAGLAAVVVAGLIGAVLAAAGARPQAHLQAVGPPPAPSTASSAATSSTDAAPAESSLSLGSAEFPFHPNVVVPATVGAEGFMSWAYLDLATGAVTGSANSDALVNTHSMIKAWLASDYLRQLAERGTEPAAWALDTLTTMIIDSDNDAANLFFWSYLGADDSINRLIAICGLTDTVGTSNDWAETWMSARDTVRMGECIADGRAAGVWTAWVLERMRAVRGDGDFGIRDAFDPEFRDTIAIKNGWWYEDGLYRVNCLAIGDTWVLAVLQQYEGWDLADAAAVCSDVATQLMIAPR